MYFKERNGRMETKLKAWRNWFWKVMLMMKQKGRKSSRVHRHVHLYFLGLITEWVPGQGGIHRNVQKSKRLEGTRNKRRVTTALSSRPKCLCVYLFLKIKDKTGSYWTVLPSQIKELMLWKAKIIVQRNASPGGGGEGCGEGCTGTTDLQVHNIQPRRRVSGLT